MGKNYVTIDRPSDSKLGSGWKSDLAGQLADAAGKNGARCQITEDNKGSEARVSVRIIGTPSSGQKAILGL